MISIGLPCDLIKFLVYGVSNSFWPRGHIRHNMTSHELGRLAGTERAR